MKQTEQIVPQESTNEFEQDVLQNQMNTEPTAEDLANEEISNTDIDEGIDEHVQSSQITYVDSDYSTYINSIKEIPLLTQQEELELAYKIRQGDTNAKQKLIQHNLKLVVSIAIKYYNDYMTPMDLIQEGNIGLMTAIDKYNPDLGYRFSTYATWWVKQAITRALSNQGRIIRLPVHMIEKVNRIIYAQKQLANEMQTDKPTEQDIADFLGWPVEEVRRIMINTTDTLSYDTPVGEDEHGISSTIGDFIQDETANTAEDAEQYIVSQFINDMIESLNEREQNIIKLRMGFYDGKVYTLQEIGNIYNVSRERIRQIESKALRKLRSPKNQKMLKQLFELE